MANKYPTASLGLVLAVGLVLGVGLMFGVTGCPSTGTECTANDDCPDGQICQDGDCVVPAPECTTSEDCSNGQVCQDGECVPCDADADCDDGLFCTGAETCVDGACQAGTEPCAEGQTCDEANDECTGGAVVSPYSTVEFDHDFHMTAEGVTCTNCHHAEPNAAGTACDVCHLDEWLGGVPKLKEAQHWTCRTCHDERAGERVRCDTCHTALKL